MLPEINNTTKPRIFRSEEERRKAREAMRKSRAKKAALLPPKPAEEPLMLTKAEAAYIAGFFDGEGMVTISKVYPIKRGTRSANPMYCLVIRIAQSSLPVLEWAQLKVGGMLSDKKVASGRGHWVLSFKSNAARRLLRTMLPYLIVKKEQAEQAIEFQNKQDEHKNRYEPGRTGPIPRTNEEIAYKEEYFQLLKKLKRQ